MVKENIDFCCGICEWPLGISLTDLDASKMHQEYLHEGFMFPKNRDIDGKRLLIFRSKLYVRGTKNMDDVKRLLVYWVERVMYRWALSISIPLPFEAQWVISCREEDLDQISVFFDLKDSGLSNMDMEYTRYIINLFKFYYPNSLNFIIIFEMPWILNSEFSLGLFFFAHSRNSFFILFQPRSRSSRPFYRQKLSRGWSLSTARRSMNLWTRAICWPFGEGMITTAMNLWMRRRHRPEALITIMWAAEERWENQFEL